MRRIVPFFVLLGLACAPAPTHADYAPANLAKRFEAVRSALEAALRSPRIPDRSFRLEIGCSGRPARPSRDGDASLAMMRRSL